MDREVVKQSGYVPNKSDQIFEICMAAVKNGGMTLEYVKKQTPEFCMAAV